ncbi:hypothetical protein, partial [Micromonospora lupini]|uniref:hypothetical protein n=1 Tax=Micromonospora lupini TaxID=285679 RepID=UPI0031D02256
MKTWLQYPAAPLIRTDRLPLCVVAVSMVAVPAPEQSGFTTVQSPDGVEPVWFSKPSQSTAPAHPTGGGVVGGGVVGGGVVGGGVVGGGVVGGGVVGGGVVGG